MSTDFEPTGVLIEALLTTQPLEALLAEATARTTTEAMGAVVTFQGVVRNHDAGQQVASLTYSAHPSAPEMMREVAESVAAEYLEVRLWVAHRTGALSIGELAFVVIAAAAHRGPAFGASSAMADRIKAEVPIWKEQELLSGRRTWVGLE